MFRIWLYLDFFNFFRALFFKMSNRTTKDFILKKISKQSQKKYAVLTSQCRVGLLFILKYLKLKTKKKEVIFCAYNLPEMINVALKLNYKIKFCDLNYNTGSMDIVKLKKKISKETSAIVLTNMFNDYEYSRKIKKIALKHDITLIEDNAIYFDNYIKKKNKYFSGSLGDYSLYSFNIMKNISSFYGGAISTNNKEFKNFYNKEYEKLKNFPRLSLAKQILIFFILKIMSISILFKMIFLHIIKYAHNYNIKTILKLFYPSLKSIKKELPNYYYSKISDLSIYVTYLQLKNQKKRNKLFRLRQINNTYYQKKIHKIKNNLHKINIIDKNYQNFLDYPILAKNKKSLNRYLLKNGIEIRYKHYYNCEKLFQNNKDCTNAERYENELICLPSYPKINFSYMEKVIYKINQYYSKSLNE